MKLFVCLSLSLMPLFLSAGITVNGLFGDNMVLQRDNPVPVWGTAEAGSRITVSFGKQKKVATVGPDGKWLVRLDPMKAESKGRALVISGPAKEQKTCKNVVVGDVWLCSGQSNMEGYLSKITGGSEENAKANYPLIRLYKVKKNPTKEPIDQVENWYGDKGWVVSGPNKQGLFSALGFLLARDLYKTYNVPVGMIQASWGGTRARQWMPLTALKSDKEFEKYYYQDWKKQYDAFLTMDEHKQKCDELKAKKISRREFPPSPCQLPTSLYNSMIHPLAPFSLRGIYWYQGESDAYASNKIYRKLFPTMIQSWRKEWGMGDIPLVFVQLPNYRFKSPDIIESPWAYLRESQLVASQDIPNCAMIMTIDSGPVVKDKKTGKPFTDIHPHNKRIVAKRALAAARYIAYGEKDISYSGPVYDKSEIRDGKVIVSFTHAGKGLKAKDGKLVGFTIAGKDKKFFHADAVIKGDKVVVSSKDVPSPVAVRYAWADNPDCNLFNSEDLPASPFRTDTW